MANEMMVNKLETKLGLDFRLKMGRRPLLKDVFECCQRELLVQICTSDLLWSNLMKRKRPFVKSLVTK